MAPKQSIEIKNAIQEEEEEEEEEQQQQQHIAGNHCIYLIQGHSVIKRKPDCPHNCSSSSMVKSCSEGGICFFMRATCNFKVWKAEGELLFDQTDLDTNYTFSNFI